MNRWLMAVCVALAGLAASQDEKRIQDLIRQLDDDQFDAREKAQNELIQVGDAAVPWLKKALESSDRSEVKLRAEVTLKQIEVQSRLKNLFKDVKTITLKADGQDVGKVAAEIGLQAGLKIDVASVDAQANVTLDLKDAPLMRALDALCRGEQERRWEWKDDGGVKLVREPQVDAPAAYSGPFRMRIVKMKLERSTDFKSKNCALFLTLEADAEKSLKPNKRHEIEIAKAVDDKGTPLTVVSGTESAEAPVQIGGGGFRVMVGGMGFGGAGFGGAEPPAAKAFTLKGLTPASEKVTLKGSAKFFFPLAVSDVRFENPLQGESCEVGEYKVKIERQMGGRRGIDFSFRRADGKPEDSTANDVIQRLDAESAVAMDEDGKEHKADSFVPSQENVGITIVNGMLQPSDMIYRATFSSLKGKIKEIRFKFMDRTIEKNIPFEFDHADLP